MGGWLRLAALTGNLARGEHPDGVVVAADRDEENDRQGNEEQRDPRAFDEFRNQHHDDGDAGDERAESIDQRALQPVRAAIFPPVHDHAGLRKREGQKRADGIERDEPVGDAAKENQQAAAEYRQDDDAVGVDEPPSAVPEGVRQVVVLRDGAAQARKIGEGGVCGERKNEQNRGDGQVVENAFAENRGDEHGEHALVAGLAGIGRRNAVDSSRDRKFPPAAPPEEK